MILINNARHTKITGKVTQAMKTYFSYPSKCVDPEVKLIKRLIKDLGLYDFSWDHAMLGEPDSALFYVPLHQVQQADCFIGLVAHTYGWIFSKDHFGSNTTDGETSYFHMEFKRAEEANIPMLIFMHPAHDKNGQPISIPDECHEQDTNRQRKLDDFRASLRQKHFCYFYNSLKQLGDAVGASLIRQIYRQKYGDRQNRDIVFISHSTRDDSFVDELAEKLRGVGAYPWVDHQHILPGASWDTTLEHALNAADALIVVMTESAVRSRNVEAEWSHFADSGKRIYPILFEDDEMPFRLRVWQYIDFRDTTKREENFAKLFDSMSLASK
jgi:TIR domain-containing protein/uncharacterized protein DUF4062